MSSDRRLARRLLRTLYRASGEPAAADAAAWMRVDFEAQNAEGNEVLRMRKTVCNTSATYETRIGNGGRWKGHVYQDDTTAFPQVYVTSVPRDGHELAALNTARVNAGALLYKVFAQHIPVDIVAMQRVAWDRLKEEVAKELARNGREGRYPSNFLSMDDTFYSPAFPTVYPEGRPPAHLAPTNFWLLLLAWPAYDVNVNVELLHGYPSHSARVYGYRCEIRAVRPRRDTDPSAPPLDLSVSPGQVDLEQMGFTFSVSRREVLGADDLEDNLEINASHITNPFNFDTENSEQTTYVNVPACLANDFISQCCAQKLGDLKRNIERELAAARVREGPTGASLVALDACEEYMQSELGEMVGLDGHLYLERPLYTHLLTSQGHIDLLAYLNLPYQINHLYQPPPVRPDDWVKFCNDMLARGWHGAFGPATWMVLGAVGEVSFSGELTQNPDGEFEDGMRVIVRYTPWESGVHGIKFEGLIEIEVNYSDGESVGSDDDDEMRDDEPLGFEELTPDEVVADNDNRELNAVQDMRRRAVRAVEAALARETFNPEEARRVYFNEFPLEPHANPEAWCDSWTDGITLEDITTGELESLAAVQLAPDASTAPGEVPKCMKTDQLVALDQAQVQGAPLKNPYTNQPLSKENTRRLTLAYVAQTGKLPLNFPHSALTWTKDLYLQKAPQLAQGVEQRLNVEEAEAAIKLAHEVIAAVRASAQSDQVSVAHLEELTTTLVDQLLAQRADETPQQQAERNAAQAERSAQAARDLVEATRRAQQGAAARIEQTEQMRLKHAAEEGEVYSIVDTRGGGDAEASPVPFQIRQNDPSIETWMGTNLPTGEEGHYKYSDFKVVPTVVPTQSPRRSERQRGHSHRYRPY